MFTCQISFEAVYCVTFPGTINRNFGQILTFGEGSCTLLPAQLLQFFTDHTSGEIDQLCYIRRVGYRLAP